MRDGRRTRRIGGGLAAAAIAASLVAAPVADARWFGANLRQSANSRASCQDFSFFQAVPSCSWTTSGATFDARQSMVVPGRGTITRVRIKVGARTGPMRITIARALRRRNSGETACCTGRRQTRVFRPRRNRITSLRVRLPVSAGYNRRSQIHHFDNLFLTMENPRTPIPAHGGGRVCSGGWFPALRPRRENFTGPYGQCGYTILIRADWRPRR